MTYNQALLYCTLISIMTIAFMGVRWSHISQRGCKRRTGGCSTGAQDRSGPGAAARAQQLADVSLFVYEAGGSTIHLPLDSSHAMVAVLKKALEREGKERPGKEWVVSCDTAYAARDLC